MEDRRFALGENFLDLESTNPQKTISDSNRDITEDAGGDADLFLKGMNKVFLAVVADLIRDLLDGKPGRGQEVLGLVDAPQQDVFIGRVSGLGLEDAGEMGGAESCGGGGVPDGQRLMEAAPRPPPTPRQPPCSHPAQYFRTHQQGMPSQNLPARRMVWRGWL